MHEILIRLRIQEIFRWRLSQNSKNSYRLTYLKKQSTFSVLYIFVCVHCNELALNNRKFIFSIILTMQINIWTQGIECLPTERKIIISADKYPPKSQSAVKVDHLLQSPTSTKMSSWHGTRLSVDKCSTHQQTNCHDIGQDSDKCFTHRQTCHHYETRLHVDKYFTHRQTCHQSIGQDCM